MITIYGASDDLVEVECNGSHEFSADDWSADLVAPDGSQMSVYCRYELSGCWSVGVGQVEEDIPLPSWPIAIGQATAVNGPGYSALLSIDAPDGTRLVNVRPKDAE